MSECTPKQNVSLAPYTTFGIGGPASYFTSIANEAELLAALAWAQERELPVTILGGGSNVLIADAGVSGLVIKNDIDGVTYTEDADAVHVTAGAGVVWNELVSETVARGLWGLENLSAIPGSVGATPIQNVGAYGVEVSEYVAQVRVYDTIDETFYTLSAADCAFAYRDSLFKRAEGKCYIVTAVTLRLSREPTPKLHYKDLAARFSGAQPSQQEIRDAVVEIRSAKFPDWHTVGTAGSFFKNPIVTNETFSTLQRTYPELPGYPVDAARTKIALGWILEHVLQLRGVQHGSVGTYVGQALVVINCGGATASDTQQFARMIEERVYEVIGVPIEWEVTYLS